MTLFDDFIARALIAIILLALVAGPLGSVAVWRRMGFFGDAMAHAGLLGVAIALVVGWSPWLGLGLIAIIVGLALGRGQSKAIGNDARLAVMAHGSLAAALVLIAVAPQGRSSLEGYLFGDILAVRADELLVMAVMALIVGLVLAWRWQRLLTAILHTEMATAHGINTGFEFRIVTLLLALVVALGINAVGALMIGAFLIIPALTARRFAHSPEGMAMLATGIALGSGFGGLALSWFANLPTAPSIVLVASFLFLAASVLRPDNAH